MAKALQGCSFTSILHRLKVLRRPDQRRRRKAGRSRKSRITLSLIPINALFEFSTSEYVSLVDVPHHNSVSTIDDDGQRHGRWSRQKSVCPRWPSHLRPPSAKE